MSRSDPMCVVYHKSFGSNKWSELLRTEVIWDTLDPDFATKVLKVDEILKILIFDLL